MSCPYCQNTIFQAAADDLNSWEPGTPWIHILLDPDCPQCVSKLVAARLQDDKRVRAVTRKEKALFRG